MEQGKIKVVIIEDEFIIAEDIRTSLTKNGYYVAATFDRAETALPFINEILPDIILVDINLKGKMSGIELVEQLQGRQKLPTIYITANSDKVTYDRAKQTNPHAFLVKPFTPDNLLAAIDLALFHFSIDSSPELIVRSNATNEYADSQFLVNQCLFIRANGKHKKVFTNDLLFIEAAGSYVHIQTKTERHTLSQNLAHFQKKTPLPNLIRIHRSYIVNLDHVDSFEDSSVFIQNHKIPLSESYKPEFLKKIHCL